LRNSAGAGILCLVLAGNVSTALASTCGLFLYTVGQPFEAVGLTGHTPAPAVTTFSSAGSSSSSPHRSNARWAAAGAGAALRSLLGLATGGSSAPRQSWAAACSSGPLRCCGSSASTSGPRRPGPGRRARSRRLGRERGLQRIELRDATSRRLPVDFPASLREGEGEGEGIQRICKQCKGSGICTHNKTTSGRSEDLCRDRRWASVSRSRPSTRMVNDGGLAPLSLFTQKRKSVIEHSGDLLGYPATGM
jgi:hypothetical protein